MDIRFKIVSDFLISSFSFKTLFSVQKRQTLKKSGGISRVCGETKTRSIFSGLCLRLVLLLMSIGLLAARGAGKGHMGEMVWKRAETQASNMIGNLMHLLFVL